MTTLIPYALGTLLILMVPAVAAVSVLAVGMVIQFFREEL